VIGDQSQHGGGLIFFQKWYILYGQTHLIMGNPNLVLDFIFDLALVTSAVEYHLAKLGKKTFFEAVLLYPSSHFRLISVKKKLVKLFFYQSA
jgi:hypothetical protein